jgi:nitroreductase
MYQRKNLFKKCLFICIGLILFAGTGNAEPQGQSRSCDLTDLKLWNISGRKAEIIDYQGKKALRLNSDKNDGVMFLKDFEFINGTIELDIAAIPSFTGLVFRALDENVYEGVYFRPQNSRDGDQAKRNHTVQYISLPMNDWYYLRDKFPGKYEAYADIAPDDWFHVRVEVSGTRVEVFVNGAKKPCLVVEDLKHGISRGSIGVWCGNYSGGTFANLTVLPVPAPELEKSSELTSRAVYTPEQEYLFDVFKNRRSVRKFLPVPVPDEHIVKILDMARTAPTSGNQQPWKFFVTRDREKLDKLKEAVIQSRIQGARDQGGLDSLALAGMRDRMDGMLSDYLSAPVYVVVLTDSKSQYPAYNHWDGPLAAENLILAARALGYGTVFITDALPLDIVKQVFEIPEQYEIVTVTPIGVPEQWPQAPAKKPLNDFMVFEKFMEGLNYTKSVEHVEVQVDTSALRACVGKYRFNKDFLASVTLEGGRLHAQATGQPKVEIYPESETEFFLKVVDAQLTFVKDETGKVTRLILHQNGQDVQAEKIE